MRISISDWDVSNQIAGASKKSTGKEQTNWRRQNGGFDIVVAADGKLTIPADPKDATDPGNHGFLVDTDEWETIEWSGGTMLFDDVTVYRTEYDTWEYNPKQVWPTAGTVDFFAHSPAASRNILNTTKTTLFYEVPQVSTDGKPAQEDFLAAVRADLSVTTGQQSGVELNFVHTLSRVMFSARTSTPGAYTFDLGAPATVSYAPKGQYTRLITKDKALMVIP